MSIKSVAIFSELKFSYEKTVNCSKDVCFKSSLDLFSKCYLCLNNLNQILGNNFMCVSKDDNQITPFENINYWFKSLNKASLNPTIKIL